MPDTVNSGQLLQQAVASWPGAGVARAVGSIRVEVPVRRPARPGSLRLVVRLALALGLAVGLAGAPAPARAEGSRSLYPATYPVGGWRANLDYSAAGSLYLNKVRRRAFLYVYAQQNEYIVLGSRNIGAANLNDISVYDPQDFGTPGDETVPGSAGFTCSGGSSAPGPHYFGGTAGTITTRAQELAGPNSADNSVTVPGGFQPCAYRAPVTGVYGVVFTGPIGGAGPNGVIDPPVLSGTTVSAWDVTVRANATSTTDLNGRLFTYAFVGFTGGNPRPVYSTHYYVTSDGYRYQQDLRGLDPNGYALYATPLGFLDNLQPLYKDIRGGDALVITNVPPGVTTQVAQYPMFFSDVSPGGPNAVEVNRVLTALGIPLAPPSPTIANVYFVGHVGGSTTTVGAGGTFHFTTTDTITYLIIVSRDGVDYNPENTANAVLTGIAATGTHAVTWDGRDQSGANFPSSATPYPFRAWGRNGEVHFPIIDSENNPGGGPTITRLNGTNPGDRTVFFDDRGYRTSSGTLVGVLNGTLCPTGTPAACVPPVSLLGVDSSTSYRLWASGGNSNSDCAATAGWGDAKGVNLWTFFSTPNEDETLVVDPIIVDVATTVTAPGSATAGSTVQGAFSFANNGNASALNVSYGMTLTPGLGTVTFGSLPGGVTASYDNGTGVVTFTGLPTTLTAGQTISGMTFSYTAPATGPIVATTTIGTTSPEETYLDNNTATASTGIGTVDVSTAVSVPDTAAAGSTVSGTFTFANFGASAAAGVTYAATIGSAGNYPASVTFTSLPTGVTATYNPANGQVTFTGLPTTLASGRSFFFAFDYPAPGPGVVPVNTAITTTSNDAVPANNTASGSTTIVAAADLSLDKQVSLATPNVGSTVTFTLVLANAGPSTATAVAVTDVVPSGYTYVAASIAGGDARNDANPATTGLTWTVNSLASGASVNLTYQATVLASGTWDNYAEITSSGQADSDSTPGNGSTTEDDDDTQTVTPVAVADLAVTKTDGTATYTPGGATTYTIVVSNAGPSAVVGATFADTFPAAITTANWTCVGAGGATCPAASGSGDISATVSLPAGGSLTYTVTAAISAGASGNLVNAATVTPPGGVTDPNPGNNSATDTDTEASALGADLAVVKTGPATFAPGGVVVYTIVVSNAGPSAATTVVVTDVPPTAFVFVGNAGDCTTAFPCSLGTVPAGATRTITTTFSVPAGYSGPAQVVNTATVFSPDDSDSSNNSSSAAADANSAIPLLDGAGLAALMMLVAAAGVLALGWRRP